MLVLHFNVSWKHWNSATNFTKNWTVILEAILEPLCFSNAIMIIGRGAISIKSVEIFIKGERRGCLDIYEDYNLSKQNAGSIQNVSLQCLGSIFQIPPAEIILPILFTNSTMHCKIVLIHCYAISHLVRFLNFLYLSVRYVPEVLK